MLSPNSPTARTIPLAAADPSGRPTRPRRLVLLLLAATLAIALPCWAVLATKVVSRGIVPDGPNHLLRVDALGYWSYLPSLFIDGDLDIANQTLPDWMRTDGVRHYPMGMAITLAPAFLVGHAVATLFGWLGLEQLGPNGYSLPYQVVASGLLALMTAVAGMMGAAMAHRRLGISPRLCAWAAGLWWVGSNISYYTTFWPFESHPFGACWAVFLCYCGDQVLRSRTEGGRDWRPFLWAGAACFCMSMLIITRLTNAVFLAPLVMLLGLGLLGGAFNVARRRPFAAAGLAVGLALLAALPLLSQSALWSEARDVSVPTSATDIGYQDHEFFYWKDPALVRVLFSSRNGLFFWSPILLIGFLGALRVVRRDWLTASLLVSFCGLWYANASWWSWWLGSGFGHRGFIELAPLWILGLASAIEWMSRLSLPKRRVAFAAVLLCVLVNLSLAGARTVKLVEPNDWLIPAEKQTAVGMWERF